MSLLNVLLLLKAGGLQHLGVRDPDEALLDVEEPAILGLLDGLILGLLDGLLQAGLLGLGLLEELRIKLAVENFLDLKKQKYIKNQEREAVCPTGVEHYR